MSLNDACQLLSRSMKIYDVIEKVTENDVIEKVTEHDVIEKVTKNDVIEKVIH